MKKYGVITKTTVALICTLLFISCGGVSEKSLSSWDSTAREIKIIKAADPSKIPAIAIARNDTLVIGTTDFYGDFNPLWADTTLDMATTVNVFGSLIEPDFDSKPIPGLADYKISEDGKTYTLTLKKDVRFSNGLPVTAKDIEFTYLVACDPSYDGYINVSSFNLAGYRDYYENKTDSVSGMKVINDKTMEFTFEKANANTIWFFSIGILSRDYYGKDFKKGNISSVKALNENPMGAGPYKLEELQLGDRVCLTANEYYFRGSPKIKHVMYSVTPVGEELERVALGEVDIDNPDINDNNIMEAKEQGFIDIYQFPTNGYGYIGFKNDEPKYSDKRVRQALIMAINRKYAVESIYGNHASVINIPQSKISWSYTEEGINSYEYNLEKAAQLLKEAGWEKNSDGKLVKDGQMFKILFSAIKGHGVTDVLLPIMKEDFGKLGIDMEAEYIDGQALITRADTGNADMWFMAWALSKDPDPSDVYSTNGPQNIYKYSNPDADALMKQALEINDINKRKELYGKIYKIINEDVPCIWLYQRSDMWVVNSRIKNFRLSPYREWYYGIHQLELNE